MIISLSGKAGAGRSTVARILCESLGYEFISIGDIKKKRAVEMGITILEFNKIGELPENIATFDLSYEQYQQDLDPQSKILLDSKLCAYNQPNSFKIRFLVSDEIAAHRLINDTKRFGDIVGDYDLVLDNIIQRNEEERQRYIRLYQFDLYDANNYDLVIHTDNFSATEVAEIILYSFERRNSKQS